MKTAAPVLALAFALAAAPLGATTFVMVPDEALVDRSPVVVEARVLSEDAAPAPGIPSTDYLIEVERVVKGAVPGSNLIVRVPGGVRPDGIGLKIWGAPRFSAGERVVLFLRPHDDGTFRVSQLMLGAFHQVRAGGTTVLVRNLTEAHELRAPGAAENAGEPYRRPRRRAEFLEWVGARAAGVERQADYFYQAAGGLGTIVDQFTLFEDVDTGFNLRWFDFDPPSPQTARWRVHQDGQPGLTMNEVLGALGDAMAVWTNDSGSDVSYAFGSPQTTAADGGLRDGHFDGQNVLLFDDPNNEIDDVFSCGSGGVLAIGGPWYEFGTDTHDGQDFHPIVGGDIITNDGLECFFQLAVNKQRLAAELFGHELGHTLGLGHSCGDDSSPSCSDPALANALMNANLNSSANRGPALGSDDVAGIRALYGNGGGGPGPAPAAPSNLAAALTDATTAVLTWQDNANNENGFRIQQKIGGGPFVNVLDVGVDVESATFSNLAPNTTYTWKVRARGNPNSAFSNEASVTTPSPLPAAPSDLTATAVSPTVVLLEWQDNSVNETGFAIEIASPLQNFTEIEVTGPGATSASIGGLVTGRPYAFRVRARTGAGNSAYSNSAGATPLTALTAACVADDDTLCLRSGRFEVEVQWRRPNGVNGVGLVQPSPAPGTTTGVFSFFNENNVELIVKALDNTGNQQHPAWWFFYGALSNVQYWITVVDTQDGVSKTYYNEQNDLCGEPDTAAFPVGGQPLTTGARRAPSAAREAAPAQEPLLVDSEPGISGTCVPSATTLCLQNGRFAVTVDWTNYITLNSGLGTAVPGTELSGYFWFTNPTNIELVIKILDNTGTPANNWWVFYGALSDLEYNIDVFDTVTGRHKPYHNPPRNFCGDADTTGLPDSV